MSVLQTPRLRTQASGTGWIIDWIGDIQVVYLDARVTEESFAEYVDSLARDIDARDENDRVSFLYYIPQPTAFSAERRTRLGQVLKARESKRRSTRSYVMVTPSLVVRSGMKMLFWHTPPPFPHAIVATPREGFDFIARHHPDVDPEACLAEHRRLLLAAGAKAAFE